MLEKILDKLGDSLLGWAFDGAKNWIVARWSRPLRGPLDYGVDEIDAAVCQQDMNRAQAVRRDMLNFKMRATKSELENYLDTSERKIFRAEQRAWEKLRDKKSAVAGQDWSGGSMEPFITAGEASKLTVERIEELDGRLQTRRRVYDGESDDE